MTFHTEPPQFGDNERAINKSEITADNPASPKANRVIAIILNGLIESMEEQEATHVTIDQLRELRDESQQIADDAGEDDLE